MSGQHLLLSAGLLVSGPVLLLALPAAVPYLPAAAAQLRRFFTFSASSALHVVPAIRAPACRRHGQTALKDCFPDREHQLALDLELARLLLKYPVQRLQLDRVPLRLLPHFPTFSRLSLVSDPQVEVSQAVASKGHVRLVFVACFDVLLESLQGGQ